LKREAFADIEESESKSLGYSGIDTVGDLYRYIFQLALRLQGSGLWVDGRVTSLRRTKRSLIKARIAQTEIGCLVY
jgi:hypothetical protein